MTPDVYGGSPVYLVDSATAARTGASPVYGVDRASGAALGGGPPYLSTYWYQAGEGTLRTGVTWALGLIRLYSFYLYRPVTITALGAFNGTAVASNNFQLAIYGNNAATNKPTGNPLAVTGNIATDSIASVSAVVTAGSVALAPGICWGAVQTSSALCTFHARDTQNNTSCIVTGSASLADMFGAGQQAGFYLSTPHTFGTWPDMTAAVFTPFQLASTAAIAFRVA